MFSRICIFEYIFSRTWILYEYSFKDYRLLGFWKIFFQEYFFRIFSKRNFGAMFEKFFQNIFWKTIRTIKKDFLLIIFWRTVRTIIKNIFIILYRGLPVLCPLFLRINFKEFSRFQWINDFSQVCQGRELRTFHRSFMDRKPIASLKAFWARNMRMCLL